MTIQEYIQKMANNAKKNEERKDRLAVNMGLTRKSLDIFEDKLREIVLTAHYDR